MQGADIDQQNAQGSTPLHIACREGLLEMVKVLVASGCNPDIRDDMGYNASWWAVKNTHHEMMEFLPKPAKKTQAEMEQEIKE